MNRLDNLVTLIQDLDFTPRNFLTGNYTVNISDWYNFNVLQRNHMNYVENLTFATLSVLAAGYYQPKIAPIFGLCVILGRLLYATGYQKKGGYTNKARMIGAALSVIGIIVNTGIFGFFCIKSYS